MYRQITKHNLLFLLVIILTCQGGILAEQLKIQPVSIGQGSLLFCVQYDRSMLPNDHIMLYVADPTVDQPLQLLWRGGRPPPAPLKRLDLNNLLFDHQNRLFSVNLTQGKSEPVLATEHQTELITVEDNKIYFLETMKPSTHSEYKLTTNKNGLTVVKSYYQPRDHLYILDRNKTNKPIRLTNLDIERILAVDDQYIWAVTAGENRTLCRIQRNGEVEEIIPFESHWITSDIYFKISPHKEYLALSLINNHYDFHDERDLIVIDLEQNIIKSHKQHIIVGSFFVGSTLARLHFDWIDENHLYYISYAYPFECITLDTESGQVEKYDLGEYSRKNQIFPIKPKRQTIGYFDLEFGLIFYQGQDTPVGSVRDENGSQQINEMAVSPAGEWAAISSNKDDETYLIDGRNKKKVPLISGASVHLKWLPAITFHLKWFPVIK